MDAPNQDFPTLDFSPGMVVDDRYEIKGSIGSGGFATVYRAYHRLIDRDVALKILDVKKGQAEPNFAERFFREAKIAARIQHANVVTIYDFGFAGPRKQPYIAMELLEGHDLSEEIALRGPMVPQRALNLFKPALEALHEGHRAGVVHKDLKPANLYLTDPGGGREALRILDFGVARIDADQVARMTDTGQLLGTPRYLAPEYIRSQIVTPAIDVYQMALIMAEAMTGKAVVEGNPYTAMMMHCNGTLDLHAFFREGPVGQVFAKALATDHLQRYKNAGEFLNSLDSVSATFERSTQPLVVWQAASYRRSEETVKSDAVLQPSVTGSVPKVGASGPTPSPFAAPLLSSSTDPNLRLGGRLGGSGAETTSSPLAMPLSISGDFKEVSGSVPAPFALYAKTGLPRRTLVPVVGSVVVLLLTLLVVVAFGPGSTPAEAPAPAPAPAPEKEIAAPPVTAESDEGLGFDFAAEDDDPQTLAGAQEGQSLGTDDPGADDAGAVAPPVATFQLTTQPSGATLYVDDAEHSVTPTEIAVPTGEKLTVALHLEGYEVLSLTLDGDAPPETWAMALSLVEIPKVVTPPPVVKKVERKDPVKDRGGRGGGGATFIVAP